TPRATFSELPMTIDATDDEWVSTVEASRLMECRYDSASAILQQLECAREEIPRLGSYWRRADVLAAKALRAEQSYTFKLPTPRIAAPKTKAKAGRPCMCCSQQFPSKGIHNRLCDLCKQNAGGLGEHSLRGRR